MLIVVSNYKNILTLHKLSK